MTVDGIIARARSGVNVVSDMLVAILLDAGPVILANEPGVVPQHISETQPSIAELRVSLVHVVH
jgi:hypothetical protein